MYLRFGVLYFLLSPNLYSVSGGKIIINQESDNETLRAPVHRDVKPVGVKNNDQDFLKRFRQMYTDDLENKETDLHQLLILKQQYIVRNRIEEFETDLALDFVPDWSKVDRWSSTSRQGIEIRRQKWEFILKNHSNVPAVQTLIADLDRSGMNRSIFCQEIAEACFILSHNSYIFNRGPKVDEKKVQFVHNGAMGKSLKIFLHQLPEFEFSFNDTEDLVKIPKSLYHKLLRKDSHFMLLKKFHESEAGRKQHLHSRNNSEPTDNQIYSVEAKLPAKATNLVKSNSTTGGYDSVLDTSSSSSDQKSSDSIEDGSDDEDNDENSDDDSKSYFRS